MLKTRIKYQTREIPDTIIDPEVEESQEEHGNKNCEEEPKPVDVISVLVCGFTKSFPIHFLFT